MKMIGNEVYIQRGEIWSLDFEVVDKKGHPLAILKNWKNPYIVITVAASLYEQKGDYRESYWLDLDKMWVENEDGEIGSELISRKRFTSAEALPTAWHELRDSAYLGFSANEIIGTYPTITKEAKEAEETERSDFDITNYLFFNDPWNDGNYRYAYLKSYDLDADGDIINEEWEEYDFRIVKRFTTRDWMEQSYLYDIKIVAGESVQEGVTRILEAQNVQNIKTDEWTQEEWKSYIGMIEDETVQDEMWQLYNDGAPLMPGFDTESILLDPTKIYVSVNLQGGIK